MLPDDYEHAMLKASYCNHTQRSSGLLAQVVQREGLTPRSRSAAAAPAAASRTRSRWRLPRTLRAPADLEL